MAARRDADDGGPRRLCRCGVYDEQDSGGSGPRVPGESGDNRGPGPRRSSATAGVRTPAPAMRGWRSRARYPWSSSHGRWDAGRRKCSLRRLASLASTSACRRFRTGSRRPLAALSRDAHRNALLAIMTTDPFPKESAVRVETDAGTFHVGGMTKGRHDRAADGHDARIRDVDARWHPRCSDGAAQRSRRHLQRDHG